MRISAQHPALDRRQNEPGTTSRGQAAKGQVHLSLETSDVVIFPGYDDSDRGRLVGTLQNASAQAL